jgi:hypothetical protein
MIEERAFLLVANLWYIGLGLLLLLGALVIYFNQKAKKATAKKSKRR